MSLDWKKNSAGELYLPLHPHRAQDHLRVWHVSQPDGKGPGPWLGAVVIDGEYLLRAEGATDEFVKRAIVEVAKTYFAIVRAALG